MPRPMSHRVERLAYKHAEDGHWYQHTFDAGVELRPERDGSVRLQRPDGKPVWDRFEGKPSRFLVNPPARAARARTFYDRREAEIWRERLLRGDEGNALEVSTVERDPAIPTYYRVEWVQGPQRRRRNPGGRVTRVQDATKKFQAADDAFSAALVKQFGKRAAANRRYSYKRDDWGPALRRAHEHRERARREFDAAWDESHARSLAEFKATLGDGRRTNPKGGAMARRTTKRRRKAPSAKQRAARKRFAAMARARAKAARGRRRAINPAGGSGMAKRRRRRRSNPGRAVARRRAYSVRRHSARRHHRRRRSNPGGFRMGGMVGRIGRGLVAGASVSAGTMGAVVVGRQFAGVIPDTTAGGHGVSIRQGIVALIGTMFANFLPARVRDEVVAGLWAAPIQTEIRASGVPALATSLGECDSWGMGAYAPRISGYAPSNRIAAPANAGVGDYAPTGYSQLGLQ